MGGEAPQASLQADVPLLPTKPQVYNPTFSNAYQKKKPQSYFQNDQITDPSSVLNAYMKNVPQFQKSVQSSNEQDGPSSKISAATAFRFLMSGGRF